MAEPKKGEAESRLSALKKQLRKRAAAAQAEAKQQGQAAEGVLSSKLADSGAYSGRVGSIDDRRRKSRTQEMAERAQQSGKAVAPTNHTLDLGTETGVTTEMARASMEPDWNDNPEHLDTPAEVRASLRADGLDPMDVGTKEEASFGHFLVHTYADDPDHGGRTPAQLEAEHDMVVAAMNDHGVNHRSPLDMGDIVGAGLMVSMPGGESEDDPFDFEDPFGLAGGGD